MLEYLGVSKRICLYLARKNAQQTIDHLVYEVSLQLLEDEGPATADSSGGSTTGSSGYQHHRTGAPREFAAVLQQHTGSCKTSGVDQLRAAHSLTEPDCNLHHLSHWNWYSACSSNQA